MGEPVQAVQSPVRTKHAGDRFSARFGGVDAWDALNDSRFFHQGGVEFRRRYSVLVSSYILQLLVRNTYF